MGLNGLKNIFIKLFIGRACPMGLGIIHSSFAMVFSSYDFEMKLTLKKIKNRFFVSL